MEGDTSLITMPDGHSSRPTILLETYDEPSVEFVEAAVDDGSGSGLLTEDAFTEYYATLSHEIKSDAAFEEMVCYCWALAYTEASLIDRSRTHWGRTWHDFS